MARFDPVRPRLSDAWFKAHGLGNDYLVFEQGGAWTASAEAVERVCDRWRGVGGDGIVALLLPAEAPFRLRMFNPDGGEFERSGNGLRVLAAWLHRTGRVEDGGAFEVEVGGDRVGMTVHGRDADGRWDVSVQMGRARTGPGAVGLDAAALEAGDDPAHGRLRLDGEERVPVHLVSVGNPHCVVWLDALEDESFRRLGPALATHPAFAHGTNVQLARVLDREARVVEALIWERGVGPTSASGTSSCAVAASAVHGGRLEAGPVEVRMEGGSLRVEVGEALDVVLRGPVEEAAEGRIAPGLLDRL